MLSRSLAASTGDAHGVEEEDRRGGWVSHGGKAHGGSSELDMGYIAVASIDPPLGLSAIQ